jgi:S-DNA-T family DNA segregation ATPase FtsK/SpoIIIE
VRPEHQREFFALALITLAAATLMFAYSESQGGLGAAWMTTVGQAFGAGALWVPLTLGVLGLLILFQELLVDLKFTSANVVGILLVLAALLCFFETRVERPSLWELQGEGGGMVGYLLLRGLLQPLVGEPVARLLAAVLGLVGVLLTFNITLRELVARSYTGARAFWSVVWAPPARQAAPDEASVEPPQPQAANRQARVAERGATAYVPPPGVGDDDLITTPIAERPTKASLFKKGRADEVVVAKPAPPQPAAGAQPPLEITPVVPDSKPAEAAEPKPVTQEALDGFEVPAVQRAWPLPTLELLDSFEISGISDDELRVRARLIEETLASFKVESQVIGINPGPAVTQFELQPAAGVKVSKITTLEKDLALALAAPSIRIEAPIPGKNALGIEIPNSAIAVVSMRETLDSEEFSGSKAKLKLPLGKAVSGNPVIADMTAMPHLLVAGSTGSGKSVCVNAFVSALLLRHTPDELKFIMVDPKMVELIVYNRIPHLLSPVVTELERVVPTLKWATREMERRYKIFARHGFRNIESYKQAARRRADLEPLPYIVIIIDELADLMMMAPDEVETLICRLAQMARATGIHLIVATQRPSVDVVTGLIKANFPSRIAFQVTSQTDSRVILDMNGAEQLLGRGDMLYQARDAGKPVRVQGTYVSDSEVERVVSFWQKAQQLDTSGKSPGPPPPMPGQSAQQAQPARREGAETGATPEASGAGARAQAGLSASPQQAADLAYRPPAEFLSDDEQNELLPQAIEVVRQHRRASASLLQRRMRIGYSKAAQLIDLLEQQGIVGPAEEGRSREVLDADAPF